VDELGASRRRECLEALAESRLNLLEVMEWRLVPRDDSDRRSQRRGPGIWGRTVGDVTTLPLQSGHAVTSRSVTPPPTVVHGAS
jgi:hypothetical protein